MANSLFYARVKVRRNPESTLPEEYVGAFVPAFAAAEDHNRALGLIIPDLVAMGWIFEELENHRVDEMLAEHWDAFVEATWPELKDELPDQAGIDAMLEAGGMFYGPLAVWGE